MPHGYAFTAIIFDLDGVITRTAKIHAKAWKIVFDRFLEKKGQEKNCKYKKFSYENDYLSYVDGKPRCEGTLSFLESRNIRIPEGSPSDTADMETICGLSNRKNKVFLKVIQKEGVEVFESTITLIKDLRTSGIRVGVASSSKNCKSILKSAGIENYFETRVDGVVSEKFGLKGKPEGDIFVKAAENLGAVPGDSVIVEDAVSGVQAGKNGKFGLVIGVARGDNASELLENGADVVLKSFKGVTAQHIDEWFRQYKGKIKK
ncbi:MAG: beta-phosphoglucomutase family hydrolase [Actinomycetota bacterium]|nr:beta-phosphoglucomutase family hydrolase [Actinomycetota bacterium]